MEREGLTPRRSIPAVCPSREEWIFAKRIRQSNPVAVGKGFSTLPLNALTPVPMNGTGVRAEGLRPRWLVLYFLCSWAFGACLSMAGGEGRGPATQRFSWNSHGIWEFFRGFRMDLNPDQTEPYLRKSGSWFGWSGSRPSFTFLPDRWERSRSIY